MTLYRLPRSFKSFVTMVTAGQRTSLLTFEELGPLLIQEEAREKLFNKSKEKTLYSKDKSGKGKPKDPKKAKEAEQKKKMKCFYCEKPRNVGRKRHTRSARNPKARRRQRWNQPMFPQGNILTHNALLSLCGK